MKSKISLGPIIFNKRWMADRTFWLDASNRDVQLRRKSSEEDLVNE